MKTEWKAFLENAGAVIEKGKVLDFGNAVREVRVVNTGSIISDLSHQGLIAVYGEDAKEFLQGQFTNDISEISETHSQLSGLCNAKGRLLAIARVFQRSDTLYLRLPRNILDETIKKLRMYVLRSKVTLEDATDTFVRVGLSGPGCESQLKDILGHIPEHVNDAIQVDNHTVIKIPGVHARYEIVGEIDSMQKLWGKLDVHAAPVGSDAWGLINIYAGVASVFQTTLDMFVPQMVNLDLVDGINFKKGCYTGQEIVARMHYLGKLKQRMYLAHAKTDQVPARGAPLYAGGSDNKQSIGNIVDARPSPDGNIDLLAVIKNQYVDNTTICIDSAEGIPLEIRELPYSLESEQKTDRN